MRPGRLALVLAICALSLGGCVKKKAVDAVPDEALDAIAQAAEVQLNAPVTSIFGVLKQADDTHRVRWTDLSVGFDNRAWPVNWWLYRHAYLDLSGLKVTEGAPFLLSKKANDLLAAGDQPWFAIDPGTPTRIDCTSPTLPPGACNVDLSLKPKLTDAGTTAQVTAPGAFTVQATVALGDEGWQVNSLTPTGSRALHNITLDTLLGPEATRPAMLAAVNEELAAKTGQTPEAASASGPLMPNTGLASPRSLPPPDPAAGSVQSNAPTQLQYGPGGRQKL